MTVVWCSSLTARSGCPIWTRFWISGRLSDPLAQHVIRPRLVRQNSGQEDRHDDRHDLERVRRGRGVVYRQVIGGAEGGGHNVRIEVTENTDDHEGDRDHGRDEGPPPTAGHDK